MHFASVCVNYNSPTKVRVRRYNVTFYILLTFMEEFFIYVSPIVEYYSDIGSPRYRRPNITPFVPLLSHPIKSLGHIMNTSSSRMGIVFKKEHLLADVSAMMSSELRRRSKFFVFFNFLRDVFPQVPVQPST